MKPSLLPITLFNHTKSLLASLWQRDPISGFRPRHRESLATDARGDFKNKGVTAVYVAVMIFVFLGAAMMAVDVGHLMVVRNQLQNAADAGALAGASELYLNNSVDVNFGANDVANAVATSNYADGNPVEVNSPDTNIDGVQRGYWDFASRTFTQSDATVMPDVNTIAAGTEYVNAIQVVTQRGPAIPAASFFAKVFNHLGFNMSTSAVAAVTWAGTFLPGGATAPIGLCADSITDPTTGKYSCEKGRFINSGTGGGVTNTSETGYWTDESYGSDSSCSGTTSTNNNDINNIINVSSSSCNASNSSMIPLNSWLSTNNGQMQNAFSSFRQCWIISAGPGPTCNGGTDPGCPTHPWLLTLPVLDCANGSPGCNQMIGQVKINVLWITGAGSDPSYAGVPQKMFNPLTGNYWTCPAGDTGAQCWSSFVSCPNAGGDPNGFCLQNPDGTPANYLDKSIYMDPSCTSPDPADATGGGGPFGLPNRIPYLVQ